MKRNLIAPSVPLVCLAFFLAVSARAGDENPFKSAKVGDWAGYSTTMVNTGEQPVLSTMKQTVKAKDETSLTLTMEMEFAGQKQTTESTIPLNPPAEPEKKEQEKSAPKVEKVAEGDETITVAGKQYACHWVQTRMTVNMQGMEKPYQFESKTWTCKVVPLGGMVKTETSATNMAGPGNTTTSTVLTGCGRGQ